MTPLATSLLALLLASTVTCAPEAEESPSAQPRYLVDQVIVKFRDGTAGAAAVGRAMAGEPGADSQLAAHLAGLEERLGAPLQVGRVTGGREVLVGPDPRRLAEELAERLSAMPTVVEAEIVADDPETPSREVALRVAFEADGELATALAAARRKGSDTDPRLDEFVEASSEGRGARLAYRIEEEIRLTVLVDLAQLTRELAARLAALDEVEYAELDQIMQHAE